MPITNRDLPVGTRLVAKFKKGEYACAVEQDEEGKTLYVLPDGRRFTSPSAAGSAITGGAINGWRFWSLEGEEPPPAEKPADQPKTSGSKAKKPAKLIAKTPNQKGVSGDEVRYFCNACMKSFTDQAGTEPDACPEGHRADDSELTADVEV
jgi:hypothetical protein